MSYQRLAEAVLVDWREVEDNIRQTRATSPEVASLKAEVVGLRDEYQQLIDAAVRGGKPVPPPFPREALDEADDL